MMMMMMMMKAVIIWQQKFFIFRTHRMHETQPIATHDPGVCRFVCHAASVGFGRHKRLNGSTAIVG